MSNPRRLPPTAANRSPISTISEEDWEDWEDEEVVTPIVDSPVGQPLVQPGSESIAPARQPRQQGQRVSAAGLRMSMSRVRKSKLLHRQKVQNAMAGITVVTDMSIFLQQKHQQEQQRQRQHIASQVREEAGNRVSRTGKFVDAAALMALEGKPHSDSSSTFGTWLKKVPTKGKRVAQLATKSPVQDDLSPSAAPIMIGFEMPKDSDIVISPHTAVVETPVDFPFYLGKKQQTRAPPSKLPVSAWSPDTEDGIFSPQSQIDSAFSDRADSVPAVPIIPSSYRDGRANDVTQQKDRRNIRDTTTTAIYVSDDDDDDDDMATPVTLFEEDGSPVAQRKSYKLGGRQRSNTAGSASSRGWWDQVTSPFVPTPATPKAVHAGESATEENKGWWGRLDRKEALSPITPKPKLTTDESRGHESFTKPQQRPPQIIVQDFSPASPEAPSSSEPAVAASRTETHAEKARILLEESRNPTTAELPPPYSPPSESRRENVRYRAVLPPGHQLSDMYPPSPGPVPPGLSNTMTSQGAISLADVPLTPPPASRLPDRPIGSALPGDHFHDVSGRGTRQKAERKRRRHEKEDVVARKTTRMWRGRGCFSSCGCFGLGRAGAAGRKRRRAWLGILAALLVLTILGVVLGVVLSRRKGSEVAAPSRFVNLTNFPPMPTGISTIVGPESDTTATCVNPPTLWSCSLPKEQADSAKPFNADQPSFVFLIQFDNDTRQLWNIPPGETPRPTLTSPAASTSSVASATSSAARPTTTSNSTAPTATASPRAVSVRSRGMSFTDFVHRLVSRQNGGQPASAFKSDPLPPAFAEMFFLGNTTDGVVSEDKAGEPTPFYITMLKSIDDTEALNALNARSISSRQNQGGVANISDLLPPPVLNPDGTGAEATLLPLPKQQPVRLYDRGLPTERYSFYTYYNKTTYVKSIDGLRVGGENRPVPGDQNGGSLRSEAKFVVTWLQARYKVEIWTRKGNNTRLIGNPQGSESNSNSTQPGTFPFPITITLDTHGGGDPRSKFAFIRGVDDKQRIVSSDAKFVLNNMNTKGDLVNPGGSFNPSFGGFDGGKGGCKGAGKIELQQTTSLKICHPRHGQRYSSISSKPSTLTLAIETSCDDTCVAILEKSGPAARLLFNKKLTSDSTAYRGIHPIVSVEAHTALLADLVKESLHYLPEHKGDPSSTATNILPTIHPTTNSPVLRRLPDFVSVTRGPGMTSGLAVGLTLAKGLSVAWQSPYLGVHHMQAHALTPRLVHALSQPFPSSSSSSQSHSAPPSPSYSPRFPFLTLLISGGHTQLVLSRSLISHSILATTVNVAIGDMLDKAAREIMPESLLSSTKSTMYGAALEAFAFPPPPPPASSSVSHDYTAPSKPKYFFTPFEYLSSSSSSPPPPYPKKWHLTPPHNLSRSLLAFDFSGLGGQIRRITSENPGMPEPERRVLARQAMRIAFEHLAYKTLLVLQQQQQSLRSQPADDGQTEKEKEEEKEKRTKSETIKTLVVAGGVASNKYLRTILRHVLDHYGFEDVDIVAPPPALCTDNAAMIAWTGMEMWEEGWESGLEILPARKWGLDAEGEDGGIMGLGGWKRRKGV
ncbi:hypothetical protein QBC42DRAFT_215994 [Cladorrhinum samala]|uniref:Gcp-like domain-containing protein n=1 Tax=Cladorrhinum samala TaxID=585594 RepID=A0AAV9I4S3_9PEZI|nr:hypothetical protein QBC42DRAFT_215994 [Cladorrhinum samala]